MLVRRIRLGVVIGLEKLAYQVIIFSENNGEVWVGRMPESFRGYQPRGYRMGVLPSVAKNHGARIQGQKPNTRHDVSNDPRLTPQ
jgi:hypothetical protein